MSTGIVIRKSAVNVLILVMCSGIVRPVPVNAAEQDVYGEFNRFCVDHFGAEKEPLVYEKFGRQLKIVEQGKWMHVSETSACIAWETSLPARTRVEYGKTREYGSTTPETERAFYIHVHYLRDLEAGKTYHYRLVSVDERGNRLVSEDASFALKRIDGAIYIPGNLGPPPYNLDKAGATYVVTRDLTADGTAFNVKAEEVTLDLGGHTVTYNDRPMEISGAWTVYRERAAFGVKAQVKSVDIYNGRIKQGAGGNAAATASIGFNPVYLVGVENLEMAGVTCEYAGAQVSGIYLHWCRGKIDLHHNVILSHATRVLDRHQGCSAIISLGEKSLNVHHSLVKRVVHGGLIAAREAHNNEVYVDSYASNAFGITADEAHGNRIFGTGFYVTGIPYGKVTRDNFIHLEAQADVRKRWSGSESGRTASLNGFRITQYAGAKTVRENTLYHDNVVVIRGRDDVVCRGTQFFSDPYLRNTTFRNNVVKVLSMDEKTTRVCCVATEGLAGREGEQLPVYYRDNTFISNYSQIRFGNYYGQGSNHHFYDCRLVRTGDDPRYRTFVCDHEYNPSRGHVFRDCELEGGADFDSVHWGEAGERRDFTVQWTLTVRTAPGAKVLITDKRGEVVFTGNANDKGSVSAPLSQYMARQAGKTYFTPHRITVEKDGRKSEKSVTLDKKQEVEVNLQDHTRPVP